MSGAAEVGHGAPLITVVTVCYNALSTLPDTVVSLFAQRAHGFEWVVVDGGSSDGTREWLLGQRQRMAAFVSEPDRGIYDAMNKAIGMARGDWLLFLNADDTLVDDEVLADMTKVLRQVPASVGIVFGDAVYSDGQRHWPRRFHWVTPRKLVYGDLCHQVVFARRDLFGSLGRFDTGLRYNADFDWLLRAASARVGFRHVPRLVANFYKGGAHVKAAEACEAERFGVRHRYRPPALWRAGNLALRIELKLRRWLGQAV